MKAVFSSENRSLSSPEEQWRVALRRMEKLWEKLGKQFTSYWLNLTEQQRREKILEASPTILEKRGDILSYPHEGYPATDLRGLAALSPEINLADLTGNGGHGLIEQIEYRVKQARDQVEWDETPDETAVLLATTADQEDVTHVLAQLTANKLVNQEPKSFVFLQRTGKFKAGQVMEATHPDGFQRMSALMASSPGVLCPAGIYNLVRLRQNGALAMISILIENYRSDELGGVEHAPSMVRALGCGGCGASEPEGVSFNFCSRCKFIVYCSKECQKSHWRTHKTKCIQRS